MSEIKRIIDDFERRSQRLSIQEEGGDPRVTLAELEKRGRKHEALLRGVQETSGDRTRALRAQYDAQAEHNRNEIKMYSRGGIPWGKAFVVGTLASLLAFQNRDALIPSSTTTTRPPVTDTAGSGKTTSSSTTGVEKITIKKPEGPSHVNYLLDLDKEIEVSYEPLKPGDISFMPPSMEHWYSKINEYALKPENNIPPALVAIIGLLESGGIENPEDMNQLAWGVFQVTTGTGTTMARKAGLKGFDFDNPANSLKKADYSIATGTEYIQEQLEAMGFKPGDKKIMVKDFAMAMARYNAGPTGSQAVTGSFDEIKKTVPNLDAREMTTKPNFTRKDKTGEVTRYYIYAALLAGNLTTGMTYEEFIKIWSGDDMVKKAELLLDTHEPGWRDALGKATAEPSAAASGTTSQAPMTIESPIQIQGDQLVIDVGAAEAYFTSLYDALANPGRLPAFEASTGVSTGSSESASSTGVQYREARAIGAGEYGYVVFPSMESIPGYHDGRPKMKELLGIGEMNDMQPRAIILHHTAGSLDREKDGPTVVQQKGEDRPTYNYIIGVAGAEPILDENGNPFAPFFELTEEHTKSYHATTVYNPVTVSVSVIDPGTSPLTDQAMLNTMMAITVQLCKKYGIDPNATISFSDTGGQELHGVAGHKEILTHKKIDPQIDMDEFRAKIKNALESSS